MCPNFTGTKKRVREWVVKSILINCKKLQTPQTALS